MTPGPRPAGGEDEDALVALRLVLVALDDDTETESRNDAISVIANGLSEERWCVIALRAARLAAFFATSIYGSPASEEARLKARTAVQKLLVGALDRRNGPG